MVASERDLLPSALGLRHYQYRLDGHKDQPLRCTHREQSRLAVHLNVEP